MDLPTIPAAGNMHITLLSSNNGSVHAPSVLLDESGPSPEPGLNPNHFETNMTSISVQLDPQFSLEIYSMVPYEVPGMKCVRNYDILTIYFERHFSFQGDFGVFVNSLVGELSIDDLVENKNYQFILLKGIHDCFKPLDERIDWSFPNLFLVDIDDEALMDILCQIGAHRQIEVRDILKKIIKDQNIKALNWYLRRVDMVIVDNPFQIEPEVILYSFKKRKLIIFDFLITDGVFTKFFWGDSSLNLPYQSSEFYLFAAKQPDWKELFDLLCSKTITLSCGSYKLFQIEQDVAFTTDILKTIGRQNLVKQDQLFSLVKRGFCYDERIVNWYKTYWKRRLFYFNFSFARFKCLLVSDKLRIKVLKSVNSSSKGRKQIKNDYMRNIIMLDNFIRYDIVSCLIFEFLCGPNYRRLHR